VRSELDAAQWSEAPADRHGQIGLAVAVAGQDLGEQVAQFGFHGAAIARGANPQPLP
jgi:hypothetical protein